MPRKRNEPIPVPQKDVTALLKDCIQRKGLRRDAIAGALGIKTQTVYNIFNGTNTMSMTTLGSICAFLDYPIDDVLAGRPWAEPRSIEAVSRDLQRAVKRIDDLEKEVKALREDAGKLFT